jgi:hypothetical protein
MLGMSAELTGLVEPELGLESRSAFLFLARARLGPFIMLEYLMRTLTPLFSEYIRLPKELIDEIARTRFYKILIFYSYVIM